MEGVVAGDDECGQFAAQQVFGLCTGRSVAVEHGARPACNDQLVVFDIHLRIARSKLRVAFDHGSPRAAARVSAKSFAVFLHEINDSLHPVLMHEGEMFCEALLA